MVYYFSSTFVQHNYVAYIFSIVIGYMIVLRHIGPYVLHLLKKNILLNLVLFLFEENCR